jgi:glycosyltransferase involved in cell wall biosynthesis
MRGESARQHFTVANRFLSVSRTVSEVLHETFGVAPEKIDLVHGFVPAPPSTPEERQARRRQLLDGLGWSHDSFVVGACGRMGWRKGTDLFLQIASRLSGGSGGGAYRFLWVGDTGGEESLRFHHDAQNLGIADRCVETMVAYAGDRHAFGKPIAEFGQIQKYIADSYAVAAAARCLVYREAARVSPDSRNRLGTDAAKLFAAPVAKRIADNAMQVLGGYGYTREYKIERFLRDAKLNEIGGGTLESHQKNIARDLTRKRTARG